MLPREVREITSIDGDRAVEPMSTVLVIDDDTFVREVVRVVLSRAGYAVLVATGGAEGLELAREHRPAAIILDARMPDVDGFAVLEQLRAGGEAPPVVMLTAEAGLRESALSAGAAELLRKPFVNAELVDCIGRLIAAG